MHYKNIVFTTVLYRQLIDFISGFKGLYQDTKIQVIAGTQYTTVLFYKLHVTL